MRVRSREIIGSPTISNSRSGKARQIERTQSRSNRSGVVGKRGRRNAVVSTRRLPQPGAPVRDRRRSCGDLAASRADGRRRTGRDALGNFGGQGRAGAGAAAATTAVAVVGG